MGTELTTGVNQNVSAGQMIRSQGSSPDKLIILHKGTVSIRTGPRETQGGDVTQSKYMISLSGPAIISSSSLFRDEPTLYFAIAETNCVVSVYPTSQDNFKKIVVSKPTIAVLMLKTALNEVNEYYKKATEANELLDSTVHTIQSLSLAFTKILPDQFNEKPTEGSFQDPIVETAKKYIQRTIQSETEIPEELSLPFLTRDYSNILGKDDIVLPDIHSEQMELVTKLIRLDANILAAIAKRDPDYLILAGQILSKASMAAITSLDSIHKRTEQFAKLIFLGEYSWISKIALQVQLAKQNKDNNKNLITVCNFIYSRVKNIDNGFMKLWASNEFSSDSPAYNTIEQYAIMAQKESAAAAKSELTTQTSMGALDPEAQIIADCKDSAKQILQYAEIEQTKQKEMIDGLTQLKTFSNPLDSDGDVRKHRRHLTLLYWEVYEKAILKHLRTKSELPRIIEIFLLTGFFDEELLEKEQIVYLFNNVHREKSEYPIYDVIDWLTAIYDRKLTTSVTELGITFFENLRQEHRDAKWKKEVDLPPDIDSPQARVSFEIANMLTSTTKLTSGSIMTHFPILNKYAITMPLDRCYYSKKKVEEEINRLLKIDFGVFHREVLFSDDKIGINREFIQMQVIPNIILAPSYGFVFQFWQEREGNNKTSRGRLIAPHFTSEDSFGMLLHVAGAYRWELTKTILGPDYNNISTPSLTAEYIDYVQFFKKNRELSPDHKEKLSAEFKRFRDDRSRFVNDYINWVKFESDGTQKFNKVIRKIMAKNIPFTKEIREKLLKLPNFSEIITKATNMRKRKANELGPRYKKYRTNNDGILPKELEDTIKFYNMDF